MLYNSLLVVFNKLIISIIFRTEEEIGLDNLKEVEVPAEYKEKFHKMDKDYLEEDNEEIKEEGKKNESIKAVEQ